MEVSRWESRPCTPQNTASGSDSGTTVRITPGTGLFSPLPLARTHGPVPPGSVPSPPHALLGWSPPRARIQETEPDAGKRAEPPLVQEAPTSERVPRPECSSRMLPEGRGGAVARGGGGASLGKGAGRGQHVPQRAGRQGRRRPVARQSSVLGYRWGRPRCGGHNGPWGPGLAEGRPAPRAGSSSARLLRAWVVGAF